ncbi:unnamed protein product [Dibothriocephalus latus]|uniref:EF-hand domain-containing protein n=1 Tax=Dibothriocephalus latus TaxID=60516 RepID=A0A3P7P6D1_DIBLA|nr:unnamed protein product [Dibothriocephalus latus]
MFQFLKQGLPTLNTEEDSDEGVRDLVEITFKRLDFDHDGRVSLNDFLQAVDADPLLLGILGPCFPDEKVS